jgi:hypothetical protein
MPGSLNGSINSRASARRILIGCEANLIEHNKRLAGV